MKINKQNYSSSSSASRDERESSSSIGRKQMPLNSFSAERIRHFVELAMFGSFSMIGASHLGYFLFQNHEAMIVVDSLSGAVLCFLMDWMMAQMKSRKKKVDLKPKFVFIFCLWAALKSKFEYQVLIASLEIYTLYLFRKKNPVSQMIKKIEFWALALCLIAHLYSVYKKYYNLVVLFQLLKAGLAALEWTFFHFSQRELSKKSKQNMLEHQKIQANLNIGLLSLVLLDGFMLMRPNFKASMVIFIIYELYFLGAVVFLILFQRQLIRIRVFRSIETVYHISDHLMSYQAYYSRTYIGHMNIKSLQKIYQNRQCSMDLCVLCCQNPCEVIFTQCNHVCLCEGCAIRMKQKAVIKCPICHSTSNRHLKLEMEPFEKFSFWRNGIEVRGLLTDQQYMLKMMNYQ